MCSSPVSTLADISPEMIHVPGRPTNCAEVVGLILLATLRQPECEASFVTNLWNIYVLIRFSRLARHKDMLSSLVKDLPHEVREDLAREVSLLNDAGSVILGRLLAEEGAVRTQLAGGLPTGLRPGRALD